MQYVKLCPRCQASRPMYEDVCENVLDDGLRCEFSLFEVAPTVFQEAPQPALGPDEPTTIGTGDGGGETAPVTTGAPEPLRAPDPDHCSTCNAPVEPDDAMCLACGAAIGEMPAEAPKAARRVADWVLVADLPGQTPDAGLFLARRQDDEPLALLRWFQSGVGIDAAIYPVLESLQHPSVPRLLAHGRVEDRSYEVWEHIDGPTLAEIAPGLGRDTETLEQVAGALIGALTLFERRGLRHGNLQPTVIRQRSASPAVLAITDFAGASVAEFDVEASPQRAPNRYMAPEAIAAASSAASDWWSLGIILLELLTQGKCFDGIHERAFLLHLVSRGVTLPETLTPRWRNLLEGLLTRDHAKRWKADQALQWLTSDEPIPTAYEGTSGAAPLGAEFTFAGQRFTSPADVALFAAQETHWNDAVADLEHGRIATWLATFDKKAKKGENYDLVARIAAESDQRVPKDIKLALALAAMNRDLPLCIRSAILTPAALLADPAVAIQWLSPPVLAILRKLKRDRDRWLLALAERADRVRARGKDAKLEIDESQFTLLRLVTSTAALTARWDRMRPYFPDSAHAAVASLIERRLPSDEDLLLLLSLKHHHFKALEEVLRGAEALAKGQSGEPAPVPEFDREAATALLSRPRRELVDELNARIPGFERCARAKMNDWVDSFRSANRRMPLARLLVTLAVPADEWKEPEETPYIKSVLGHMHRRVLAGIQKGSLVQMRATSGNLDLSTLVAPDSLTSLLDAIVSRGDQEQRVGARSNMAASFFNNVRALDNKARSFQRDTGMEALYVGYPFLTLLDRTEDGDRTRIAPLILWPVKLNVAAGATGTIAISSDPGREVALNPALETILGPVEFERWSEVIGSAIKDGFDSRGFVLSALGDLVDGDIADTLAAIPKAATVTRQNVPEIRAAAALFLAEFPSQAIANDLTKLQEKPLDGTALHCLLRLEHLATDRAAADVPHVERFATLEADPSQEEAVARSRAEPGLVVQGPPGTGKSQTIVNIIADCLGRGQSVLVVCEKKAALDVVQKRLTAERLGDRVVRVENTATDRSAFINSLKTHVATVKADVVNHASAARQKRVPIAAKIDALESDLDAYHDAVHATDERLGLSYREVLSLIAAQNLKARGLSAPELRAVLGPLTATELETVIGACKGLVDVWVTGGVPGAALAVLKPLAVDEAQAEGLASLVAAFFAADEDRVASLADRRQLPERHRGISCGDENALRDWLRNHSQDLRSLPASALRRNTAWRPYFSATVALRSEGEKIKSALAGLVASLDAIALPGPAQLVHEAVSGWPESDIATLAAALPVVRATPSILDFLNVPGFMSRRAVRLLLASHGVATERAPSIAHAEAACYESSVRSHAARLAEISAQLGERATQRATSQRVLLASAHALSQEIAAFERVAAIIDACPLADFWLHVVNDTATDGSGTPLASLVSALEAAQRVADARSKARELLERLRPFLTDDTAIRIAASLAKDVLGVIDTEAVRAALPFMVPYQTFRLRYTELPTAARAAFDILAPLARDLGTDAERTARGKIEALMRRETASAWKVIIETRRSHLQRLQSEIMASIAELEGLDDNIRDANRRLLATVDQDKIKSPSEWSPAWAGGAASKRLRQVFDLGRKLGLLHLKPVWLVNPDVASRMLPLEPGLFDVAIFDEASQMRVVNALPALFRAKRCVVSGDEKQLPPTTFFGGKSDGAADDANDDGAANDTLSDGDLDNAEEDALAAPRIDQRALQIAERHIKDCDDLLALSRGLLPETSLDIHYRSEYRELIAFSNAAYYGGRLNVPIRKSQAEVLRARPIDFRRIDGLYKSQTNPQEADAIVDLLAELWAREEPPPTVGVVTFNMKQAELITRRLEAKADQDRAFGKAHLREVTRKSQGEDVGFFVKNLENVQGDERDWIIFSTTFGRDEDGAFKRSFGALNQQGGERRLNVAVTRAKQKVVIITSMPIPEISDALGSGRPPVRARDYLQIYMKYAELVSNGDLDDATKLLEMFGPPDTRGAPMQQSEPDELIGQALAALHHAGFAAELLPREDAFSLDIAVSEPGSSRYVLGIEVDSPRHMLLRRARAREVWRPKLLARSGLKLHRIASAEWVRSPDSERARLVAAAHSAVNGADT